MGAFAIFRLPYEAQCHLLIQQEGQPEELPSVSSLSGKDGFVMAPFAVDKRYPVLVIHPDTTLSINPDELLTDRQPWRDTLESILAEPKQHEKVRKSSHSNYAIDFANFHSQVLEGEFSKIVLARCVREKYDEGRTPLMMFADACSRYPRMFVALVSTWRSGTWLMATPEVLLEGVGTHWSTVSLAGTMALGENQLDFDDPPSREPVGKYDFKWDIKNIQEQRFVSTYITESLEQVADFIEEKGPYTVRAGKLVHLKSDFNFTMSHPEDIGRLLSILYPTPAVCGLPKDNARDFILRNEFTPRQYYSGFAGPMGSDSATHLYVSLRCMRIDEGGCCLFAGGGIMAGSEQEVEWKETEDKMCTMKDIMHTKK
ncbi:MAG: chorismate-binding protein [Prevotella sp.]|nr:chorismate-binding protein [Prevotella sp.]